MLPSIEKNHSNLCKSKCDRLRQLGDVDDLQDT